MQHQFIKIGIIFLALAVVLGAFGAHSLETQLSSDQLDSYKTGVQYQMYHGFALLIVGILLEIGFSARINVVGWLFTIGIVLFSGSIYLLATRDLIGLPNSSFLGPITPIGGTLFIVGWILLFFRLKRQ